MKIKTVIVSSILILFVLSCEKREDEVGFTGTGNHGGGDVWIVKLDDSGNIEWQKCYGGTERDMACEIQQTKDGGYIVGGSTHSYDGDVSGMHGETDIWIFKLDESGNIQWQKCLGGSGNDYASSLQQTSDGG